MNSAELAQVHAQLAIAASVSEAANRLVTAIASLSVQFDQLAEAVRAANAKIAPVSNSYMHAQINDDGTISADEAERLKRTEEWWGNGTPTP